MFSCYKNIKSCTKKEEKNGFFLRNGGAVLEQTIRLFNGKSNPLRSYSSQQLNNATNNFHDTRIINHLQDDGHYKMYKGVIHDDDSGEDYTISVKKYTEDNVPLCWLEMIPTEVAVASQMSNHKNVLKLLGYCLDSKFPMLVYEFPVHGNLSHFLIDGNNSNEPPPPRLPFESRLRIGIGIAFGALLSELLTGKSLTRMADSAATTHSSCSCDYWFDAWKNELKDITLGEEGEELTRLQIMECAKLVEKCVKNNADERPNMVEVAKALIFIKTNKTLLP